MKGLADGVLGGFLFGRLDLRTVDGVPSLCHFGPLNAHYKRESNVLFDEAS
jgi:hypothetical protein